ncbi:MAG TPA: hypothetical protein VN193_15645 [Candidatus Angelobacter sp.]|jgi:hypothetical protein|nr:hypothetical protein [Candidatus Angelobacter sp.]
MTARRYGVALLGLALVSLGGALPASASASSPVSVRQGEHYGSRILPDNAFTVRDSRQVTGLRVNFELGQDYPMVNGQVRPGCTSADYSICDAFAELNKLDGFDIQPRVTVPLTGPIDLSSVDDSNFYITDDAGNFASGMRQLTFDPATNTLAGISDKQLLESTPYRVFVAPGIKDAGGAAVNTCDGRCSTRFTTRTASASLVNIRKSMDLPLSSPANAYRLAGFPGASTSTDSRKMSFVQNGTPDVFQAAMVRPSVADPPSGGPAVPQGVVRNDQVKVDPNAPGAFQSTTVPVLVPPASAGYYAFGSFLSPRYQYASASGHVDSVNGNTDGVMPPVPTTQTPAPFGADRLGVMVVTPDPTKFNPATTPWPVAIYGPGFTRSDYDLFVTADYNASLGIMTIATDPSGHGYGPASTATVTTLTGTSTTFLTYGRGRDLDGDGAIGDGLNDGVGPTAHRQADGSYLPSRKPIDGLQSGLQQTVVDNMALARSVMAGVDIPGVGSNVADTSKVMYYGLSFGGIYGTMLTGTDPVIHQALMNVPGGPIVDIARLSSFRNNLQTTLSHGRPNLLNGGPGLNGFTEDLPLRNDPPEVITHNGAAQLQELFGETNWFDRSGSPETFAPRILLRPDAAWANNPKSVAFQTAYGDGTVPNPTAGTLYRAGDLFNNVVYYRNDKTPTYASDPHGWLADPTLAGRTSGEQQLGIFLSQDMLVDTNPAWLETPIANPNNLECLHYADPQTGQAAARQPFPSSGDCPAAPSHGTPVAHTPVTTDGGGTAGGGSDNRNAQHGTARPASASSQQASSPPSQGSSASTAQPASASDNSVTARSVAASIAAPVSTGAGALLLLGAVGAGVWRRRHRRR